MKTGIRDTLKGIIAIAMLLLTAHHATAQPNEPCNCVCPSITPVQGSGSDYVGSTAPGVLPCATDIQHIYELHNGCTNLYIAISNCNHRSFSEIKLRPFNLRCLTSPVDLYDNTDPSKPKHLGTIPAYDKDNPFPDPFPEITIPIEPALQPCATMVIPIRACGLKFGIGEFCRNCGFEFQITIEHPNPFNPAEDAPCWIPFRLNFTGTPAGVQPMQLPRPLSIVPNPVHDIVKVNLDHAIDNGMATIYRMDGSIVKRSAVSSNEIQDSAFSIDVSELTCGAYLLEMDEKGVKSTGVFTVHK